MQKLLIFTIWLAISLTALIVIVFRPYSFDCSTRSIYRLEYLPDSQQIRLFRGGQQTELWTLTAEYPTMVESDRGWFGSPDTLALSHDGKTIIFVSGRGEATLARAIDTHPIFFFHFHANNEINLLAFAPDGKTVLLGSLRDHMAELYDVETGKLLQSFNSFPHILRNMMYSPDSKFVLTTNTSNELYIWDAQSGQRVCTLSAASNPVFSVALSNTLAANVLMDGRVELWNNQTGMKLHTLKGGHLSTNITHLAIAPDEKTILTDSYADNRAVLWDVQTGKPIRVFCPLILTKTIQIVALLVEVIIFGLAGLYLVSRSSTIQLLSSVAIYPSSTPLIVVKETRFVRSGKSNKM